MKKIEAIKDRNTGKPTRYHPAGKLIDIPAVGAFFRLLQLWDKDHKVQSKFKLAAITAEFIYYLDEKESDDTASIVMLSTKMELVSDNVFASNDLAELVEKNEGLLWISRAVKYWQRCQYIKPELITPAVRKALKAVDVDKLTPEERSIYDAYMLNGPAKYSKTEALMAVLSIDLDQNEYSEQLAPISDMLDEDIE